MPSNSQQTIQVWTPVIAAASHAFSRGDFGAFVTEIPSGGTILILPADSVDGDWYDWTDADGSCSSGSPVTMQAADAATIQGESSFDWTAAYSWARARYDADTNNWVLAPNSALSGSSAATALVVTNTGIIPAAGPSGSFVAGLGGDGMPAPANYTSPSGMVKVTATITVQATASVNEEALLQLTRDGNGVGSVQFGPVARTTSTTPDGGVDDGFGSIVVTLIGYDSVAAGSTHTWGVWVHGFANEGGADQPFQVVAARAFQIVIEEAPFTTS